MPLITRLNIRIRYATQLGPMPARSLAVVSLNCSFMGFVVYATLEYVKSASPPAPLHDLVTALHRFFPVTFQRCVRLEQIDCHTGGCDARKSKQWNSQGKRIPRRGADTVWEERA